MVPFWQSRAFWTLVLGGIFNVLVYVGVVTDAMVAVITNIVLGILGIIFRWQASGPLSAK